MYFPIIDVLKENFIAKIPSIVTQWLTDNVEPVGSAVVVDESLSISGAAADAKVTGDEISDLKSDLIYIDQHNKSEFYLRNSYIGEDNTFKNSVKWISYAYNINDLHIKSIEATLYTNSYMYGVIGFYSSDIPSNDTFISQIVPTSLGANTFTIDTFPANAKSVLLCNRTESGEASIVVTCSKIGEMSAQIDELSTDIDNINPEPSSNYKYSGERISVKEHTFSIDAFNSISGIGQDASLYGDYLFALDANGDVSVTKISTGSVIATISLPQTTYVPHANCVCFGRKYSDDDVFPCLYVNVYNTVNAEPGICYVYRFATNDSGIPTSATLVQTITVGFVTDPLWISYESESRPYGNFLVDLENGYDRGYLYVYTNRDADNVTRFFRFYLPNLGYSTYELTKERVLNYFDVPYIRFPQGGCIKNGKIYSLGGGNTLSNPPMLYVIDTFAQDIVSWVNLYENGITDEMEYITVYNDKLLIGKTTGILLTF